MSFVAPGLGLDVPPEKFPLQNERGLALSQMNGYQAYDVTANPKRLIMSKLVKKLT